jgi:2-hydroxychromene-2-carboxylate isomerase
VNLEFHFDFGSPNAHLAHRVLPELSALPADETLSGTETPQVKEQLLNNTQAPVARGNFGSPTFFVEDDMFFGKDRLRDVEEAIEARAYRWR